MTIFHWDHPLELEKRYEGFFSEAIVEDFTAFAELCFERFGDRVKHWATINEPHIFTMQSSMSYKRDVWQPKRDHARFAKSLLLCHAHTVDAYRKKYQTHQKGTIGIVFVRVLFVPTPIGIQLIIIRTATGSILPTQVRRPKRRLSGVSTGSSAS